MKWFRSRSNTKNSDEVVAEPTTESRAQPGASPVEDPDTEHRQKPVAQLSEGLPIEPIAETIVLAAADPDAQPSDSAHSSASSVADAATQTLQTAAQPLEAGKESASDGFFGRLKRGLGRTSDSLAAGVGNLFLGQKTIDAELLEELESQLLMADVGIEATGDIIESLTERVSRKELDDAQALMQALREQLLAILQPCEQPLALPAQGPYVILMVGVNGVGKTTTIGKLARRFQDEGRSVMLAAGDTFRAAAVEQLQHWGERNNVPVVAQHSGADSASVVFDALQAATARNVDVLIADTAGRLHNQSHLMDELSKVVRVMRKLNPDAPHEVMLVLDSGTGQNALTQAEQFRDAVGVSGVTLTKLDGTAKGGVIFAIARRLQLPIRFIGVGEGVEDLRPFVAADFIQALFDRD
ncbi:MAG: signal recognition particle-docking protein FtsY [Congregibacter sp.]